MGTVVGLLRPPSPPLLSVRKDGMAVRKPGADIERQRGAIRGLLHHVPLPMRGAPSWDTLVAIVRSEDDNPDSRYSSDEKARLHTARLLIDKAHPTQKMGKTAAREISICLQEYHEAIRPEFDVRKVDDGYDIRGVGAPSGRGPGVGDAALFE